MRRGTRAFDERRTGGGAGGNPGLCTACRVCTHRSSWPGNDRWRQLRSCPGDEHQRGTADVRGHARPSGRVGGGSSAAEDQPCCAVADHRAGRASCTPTRATTTAGVVPVYTGAGSKSASPVAGSRTRPRSAASAGSSSAPSPGSCTSNVSAYATSAPNATYVPCSPSPAPSSTFADSPKLSPETMF
jgi:hypothetical protein